MIEIIKNWLNLEKFDFIKVIYKVKKPSFLTPNTKQVLT